MNRQEIIDAIPQNDRGYARFSYAWEPPPIKGFKIIHVKGHRKFGAWIPERWYYRRLIPGTNKVIGGTLAREHMAALGITQCNPKPEELVVLPSNVGQVHNNLESYTRIPREQWKKRKRGYKLRPRKESAVSANRHLEVSAPVAQWVPVYYTEAGSIAGWLDIMSGRFVLQARMEPGTPGIVRGDLKVIGKVMTGDWDNSVIAPAAKTSKVVSPGTATEVRVSRKGRGRRPHAKNPGLVQAVIHALRHAPIEGWNPGQVAAQMAKDGFKVTGNIHTVVGVTMATCCRHDQYGVVRVSKGVYTIIR